MGDEVDEAIEVKPKFKDPLGGVMEGSKFAYFSKEEGKYDEFVGLLKSNPFHFYVVEYKYSSDNDGRPDFVARNLNTSFASELDECRKQFFCVFRCMQPNLEKKEYVYSSLWISTVPAENESETTSPDIKTLIGSRYDDYTFTKVDVADLDSFLADFKTIIPSVTAVIESTSETTEPVVKTTSESYDDDDFFQDDSNYAPEEPTNCVSEIYVH